METDIANVGRRKVLAVSAAAVGGMALVACGSDDKENASSSTAVDGDPTTGQQPGGSAGASADGGASAGGSGKALAKTSEIPVGGGKVFESEKIVVTQPTAGTFKAFSATCTHQGCLVSEVADGTIDCKCHGSLFSAADGSVTQGPATKALAEKRIATSGDQITLLS
ncbi:Rieske (2Fe-2S) protein [Yinghuangia sp. ASG 101]|uniref:Rieske (2Fe-2S) protein n=1 Tax=Yinghuangia sp. ASG 101 TaxID=2896848 RepID=UPI001E590AE8|nr:Rieske (2Fe-2S) protein [Yinghuangia sp. ASG 101]UGQ09319.1 Rieske (2Fe-2S) protein [Yinghuangia sp. ASG 101]